MQVSFNAMQISGMLTWIPLGHAFVSCQFMLHRSRVKL